MAAKEAEQNSRPQENSVVYERATVERCQQDYRQARQEQADRENPWAL